MLFTIFLLKWFFEEFDLLISYYAFNAFILKFTGKYYAADMITVDNRFVNLNGLSFGKYTVLLNGNTLKLKNSFQPETDICWLPMSCFDSVTII